MEGMEKVVATLTGYEGCERHKLIKLIAHTGAYYVGTMSRSITHLVCLKFEGQKYELAKKFNTIIVNHQWVEECVRQGKRVSEEPYTSESGEEVGPLVLELPADSVKPKRVYKTAHMYDKYFTDGEESRSAANSELLTWMKSIWLKEESDHNVFDNSDENRNETQDHRETDDENVRDCVFEAGETAALQHPGDSATQNWDVDEIEEAENWSHSAVFKRPRSSYSAVKKPQENVSDNDKPDSRSEDTEATEKAPAQVSCIICWTEFSSSRGVLPCGHRFCYSCIQTWADRLVSERKKTTCPLCKASFITITKMQDAGSCDQKIYSQTVPDPSSTNNILVVLPEEEQRQAFNPLSRASACTRCYLIEPEDLLIRCHLCNSRRIHSYCLDPCLLPWTCNHCSDLQMMMYQRRSY